MTVDFNIIKRVTSVNNEFKRIYTNNNILVWESAFAEYENFNKLGTPPNDEIWYKSHDGSQINIKQYSFKSNSEEDITKPLFNESALPIISQRYEDGVWKVKFSGDVTDIYCKMRNDFVYYEGYYGDNRDWHQGYCTPFSCLQGMMISLYASIYEGDWAGVCNPNFKSIILPKSVKYVGELMFLGSKLESVDVGNTNALRECCFHKSTGLKLIVTGENLTSITKLAFSQAAGNYTLVCKAPVAPVIEGSALKYGAIMQLFYPVGSDYSLLIKNDLPEHVDCEEMFM